MNSLVISLLKFLVNSVVNSLVACLVIVLVNFLVIYLVSSIVDSFVAAGADRHCSRIYAATVTGSSKEASFVEVYGRGSIMADAKLRKQNLNVSGLVALRRTALLGTSR